MSIENLSANYGLYAKRPQGQTGSVNPFMGKERTQEPVAQRRPENEPLDSKMLAEKKVAFENGLGGTNNPDDHRLFLTA